MQLLLSNTILSNIGENIVKNRQAIAGAMGIQAILTAAKTTINQEVPAKGSPSKRYLADKTKICVKIDTISDELQADKIDQSAALVLLTTIARLCLRFGFQYASANMSDLASILFRKVDESRHLEQGQDKYLSVKMNTEISFGNKASRTFSSLLDLRPSSSLSSITNRFVAPYTSDKETQADIQRANQKFCQEHIQGKYGESLNARIHRFMLDTEHGQRINVFQAEVLPGDDLQNSDPTDGECLHIITIHGNASHAAGEFSSRVVEASDFIQANNDVARIKVFSPDLPGSVASGGYASGTNEIARNGVMKLVKHLIETGVEERNIIVRGHSLGGLISATAVYELQKEGIKVQLISVDSMGQVQQFIGDSTVVGKVALDQWNNPAYQYFLSLDKDKRFCIAKEGDDLMWDNDKNNKSLYARVIKEEPSLKNEPYMVLLGEEAGGHNDDLIELGNQNPCIKMYATILSRSKQQKVLNEQNALYTLDTEFSTLMKNYGTNTPIEIRLNVKYNSVRTRIQKGANVGNPVKLLLGTISTHYQDIQKNKSDGLLSGIIKQMYPLRSAIESLLQNTQFKPYNLSAETLAECEKYYDDWCNATQSEQLASSVIVGQQK